MTPDSRLYTFIDESREFVLYFLEGQTLVQELALLHPIQRAGRPAQQQRPDHTP